MIWSIIQSLPQEDSVKASAFIETTGEIKRVNYNTEFAKYQDVYQFLIDLGNYQKEMGFKFSGFDTGINDQRDWSYAGKQFLFFVAGGWENSNTLEISSLATKVVFEKESSL